ncbi:type II secretion system F family protein [Candidatus Dependentiae bacterium]|nr:type II secretion system F family protein [Candidatus Dependentiae bacterium]
MPYYRWQGVDLSGQVRSGKLFARSLTDVQAAVARLEIGFIAAQQADTINLRLKPITSTLKADFIHHLATLLKAGVRLHDALMISARTTKHTYFKEVLFDTAHALQEGISLHEAFKLHPEVFDELTCAIAYVGEKSGNLAASFQQLSERTVFLEQFKKRLRATLIMPSITLIAFMALMALFFIVVVPRFESFFLSFKMPLPATTQFVLLVSSVLTSSSTFVISSILFSALLIIGYTFSTWGKQYKDQFLFYIPGLRNWFKLIYTTRFLQLVSILAAGGIPLAQALKIVADSFSNSWVKNNIRQLCDKVESGTSFTYALQSNKLFTSEYLEALTTVGENSGDLAHVLNYATLIYQERVYAYTHKITTLIQPLLLLVLAAGIAVLVVALYLPLFTLSTVIN